MCHWAHWIDFVDRPGRLICFKQIEHCGIPCFILIDFLALIITSGLSKRRSIDIDERRGKHDHASWVTDNKSSTRIDYISANIILPNAAIIELHWYLYYDIKFHHLPSMVVSLATHIFRLDTISHWSDDFPIIDWHRQAMAAYAKSPDVNDDVLKPMLNINYALKRNAAIAPVRRQTLNYISCHRFALIITNMKYQYHQLTGPPCVPSIINIDAYWNHQNSKSISAIMKHLYAS